MSTSARYTLSLVCLVFSSCTFIGVPQPWIRDKMNFGPPETVNLCAYKDNGISNQEVDELVDAWNSNEGQDFKLNLVTTEYIEKHRPWDDVFTDQIMADLLNTPMPATCEKRLWFVNPNLGDYVYSLTALPQVFGETDDETSNNAVVFARWYSINQLLALKGPKGITEHETYHLFGCGHYSMISCYDQIQQFKIARANRINSQLRYSKASPSERTLNGSWFIHLSPEVRGFVDDAEGF